MYAGWDQIVFVVQRSLCTWILERVSLLTITNTFSYKHEKTNSKLNSKQKMEAERRSTMSSLKGQLSNVEGSVKSMKVAVVVGSVLTVACLA